MSPTTINYHVIDSEEEKALYVSSSLKGRPHLRLYVSKYTVKPKKPNSAIVKLPGALFHGLKRIVYIRDKGIIYKT